MGAAASSRGRPVAGSAATRPEDAGSARYLAPATERKVKALAPKARGHLDDEDDDDDEERMRARGQVEEPAKGANGDEADDVEKIAVEDFVADAEADEVRHPRRLAVNVQNRGSKSSNQHGESGERYSDEPLSPSLVIQRGRDGPQQRTPALGSPVLAENGGPPTENIRIRLSDPDSGSGVLMSLIPLAEAGDSDLDELLLAAMKSADPQTRDADDNTLLIRAVEYSKIGLARAAIRRGCAVNARNRHGFAALHFACYRTSASVKAAQKLLEAGADPDVLDSHRVTPLHYAAAEGNVALIALLLFYKARVDTKDDSGYMALDYAAQTGSEQCVSLLQSKMPKDAPWQVSVDPASRCCFYVNQQTGETSWERPGGGGAETDAIASPQARHVAGRGSAQGEGRTEPQRRKTGCSSPMQTSQVDTDCESKAAASDEILSAGLIEEDINSEDEADLAVNANLVEGSTTRIALNEVSAQQRARAEPKTEGQRETVEKTLDAMEDQEQDFHEQEIDDVDDAEEEKSAARETLTASRVTSNVAETVAVAKKRQEDLIEQELDGPVVAEEQSAADKSSMLSREEFSALKTQEVEQELEDVDAENEETVSRENLAGPRVEVCCRIRAAAKRQRGQAEDGPPAVFRSPDGALAIARSRGPELYRCFDSVLDASVSRENIFEEGPFARYADACAQRGERVCIVFSGAAGTGKTQSAASVFARSVGRLAATTPAGVVEVCMRMFDGQSLREIIARETCESSAEASAFWDRGVYIMERSLLGFLGHQMRGHLVVELQAAPEGDQVERPGPGGPRPRAGGRIVILDLAPPQCCGLSVHVGPSSKSRDERARGLDAAVAALESGIKAVARGRDASRYRGPDREGGELYELAIPRSDLVVLALHVDAADINLHWTEKAANFVRTIRSDDGEDLS